MAKGLYFKLEYNIIINKYKDSIGYVLEKHDIEELDVDEYGIGFECNSYYILFSDNEAYDINGEIVYIDKSEQNYKYYPNKLFEEFQHTNWDIDDFGDNDDGWYDFIEANKEENQRYENSIQKINYEGFIVSEDKGMVDKVLNKIIEEFCKENEINF